MDAQAVIAALRDRARKYVSLDTPEDGDLGDMAIDIATGFLPVVGTAQAGRDFERARRDKDKLGMALASLGAVPVVGGVANAANKARKGGKAAEEAVKVLRGPRAEALETARQNAVKMLGLPENNTAMDRARALGYKEPDYIGVHRAPSSADDVGAPLHQLDKTYPADVYSSRGAQYYGDGAEPARDAALMRQMQALRARPDAQVNVFRAVPKDAGNFINHGDWVTMDRRYAADHGEGSLRGDYKIISTRTPAKTLFTEGNSIYELGIDKTQKFADGPASMPTMVSPKEPFERSRFAAFDPARVKENDLLGRADPALLAAIAAGGLGTAAAVSALRNRKKEEEEAAP
jgi:hypothetical protein